MLNYVTGHIQMGGIALAIIGGFALAVAVALYQRWWSLAGGLLSLPIAAVAEEFWGVHPGLTIGVVVLVSGISTFPAFNAGGHPDNT